MTEVHLQPASHVSICFEAEPIYETRSRNDIAYVCENCGLAKDDGDGFIGNTCPDNRQPIAQNSMTNRIYYEGDLKPITHAPQITEVKTTDGKSVYLVKTENIKYRPQ